MFHFLSARFSIGCLSLLFISPLLGEQVLDVGNTFTCYFQDTDDTKYNYTSTSTWTFEQIDAVTRALSTWDNLILNTPARKLSVGLYWIDQGYSALASASSPGIYYLTSGLQKCSTVAEKVWREGDASAGYDNSFDIKIYCNSNQINWFYYGADTMAVDEWKYDFQTIITHEIGHALGFITYSKSDGTFQTYNVDSSSTTTIYSAFDSLMTNAGKEQIISKANGGNQAFTVGETLALSDTGLTVYNPSAWSNGSSMCHIDTDSDPDALMRYIFGYNETQRTLTAAEVRLMSAMGWKTIPESSASTLSLLGFFFLLWRRKRH